MDRLAAHDMAHLKILMPIMRWDIGFWDYAHFADEDMERREREIFTTLFPSSALEWANDVEVRGGDINDVEGKFFNRWKNKIIDTRIFEAHLRSERDVFVTSDGNFRQKLSGHKSYRGLKICTPSEALALI
jgi:hypothetical protein